MLRYPRFENEEQPPTTQLDEIDRRWRLSCNLWGQVCIPTPRPVAALVHPVEPRACGFSRALARFVWGIVARYGHAEATCSMKLWFPAVVSLRNYTASEAPVALPNGGNLPGGYAALWVPEVNSDRTIVLPKV